MVEGKTMKFLFLLLFYIVTLLAQDSFVGWENNNKLTSAPIDSDAHNAYVEIFANSKAAKAYTSVAKEYPIGSIIYKPLYKDAGKKFLVRVVIMQKMYKGYDSENGDWFYGVSNPKGDNVYTQGRIQHCILCHKLVKDTDYMFSKSVMKKINDKRYTLEKALLDSELYEE